MDRNILNGQVQSPALKSFTISSGFLGEFCMIFANAACGLLFTGFLGDLSNAEVEGVRLVLLVDGWSRIKSGSAWAKSELWYFTLIMIILC